MNNEIKWIICNLSVSLNLKEQLEHLQHEVQIIIWTTYTIKRWNNQMINELNNQWNQINILTRIKGYVQCNDKFKLLGKWKCKCDSQVSPLQYSALNGGTYCTPRDRPRPSTHRQRFRIPVFDQLVSYQWVPITRIA